MMIDRDKISIDDVSLEDLREIIGLILDKLKLDIQREKTPDYTYYELKDSK